MSNKRPAEPMMFQGSSPLRQVPHSNSLALAAGNNELMLRVKWPLKIQRNDLKHNKCAVLRVLRAASTSPDNLEATHQANH
jgi:hypothetical protein